MNTESSQTSASRAYRGRSGSVVSTCCIVVAIGAFVGSSLLLLSDFRPVASPQNLDIPATRAIEFSNACAVANASYVPELHNMLRNRTHARDLIATLGPSVPPSARGPEQFRQPCILRCVGGPVLSLGVASYGDVEFLRVLDGAAGINLLALSDAAASDVSIWPLPPSSANNVDVHVGANTVILNGLWHDFGVVPRNTVQQARIRIANGGSEAVTASGFSTSCSCIKTSVSHEDSIVIAPGDTLHIDFSAKLGDVSDLSQVFRFALSAEGDSAPADIIYGIFASTQRVPSWRPSRLDFGVVDSIRSCRPLRIRAFEAAGEPLHIQSVKTAGPVTFDFKISGASSKSASTHFIECIPIAVAPGFTADIEGEVIVSTSSKERPTFHVPYRLTLSQRVAAE